MRHLEDTPWFICDKEDINYCAYVDTDSNYFNAEPLLLHLFPNFENLSDEEKDSKLEKVALAYQDIITEDKAKNFTHTTQILSFMKKLFPNFGYDIVSATEAEEYFNLTKSTISSLFLISLA